MKDTGKGNLLGQSKHERLCRILNAFEIHYNTMANDPTLCSLLYLRSQNSIYFITTSFTAGSN